MSNVLFQVKVQCLILNKAFFYIKFLTTFEYYTALLNNKLYITVSYNLYVFSKCYVLLVSNDLGSSLIFVIILTLLGNRNSQEIESHLSHSLLLHKACNNRLYVNNVKNLVHFITYPSFFFIRIGTVPSIGKCQENFSGMGRLFINNF